MSDWELDQEPKRRFSSRVDYYVRHRPGYPAELLDCLTEAAGLTMDTVVADVGSGTGLLAELFLKNGCTVYGVEPNTDMRLAGEEYLRSYTRFHSVDGAAEATLLSTGSVDMVSVGQAFHWFDADRTRMEFERILRHRGVVVLTWNSPRMDSSPFMRAYKAMRDHVPPRQPEPLPPDSCTPPKPSGKARLFGSTGFESRLFANQQEFDWEGLRGRVLSESGAPLPGDPRYPAMMAELEGAFAAHEVNGRVQFLYETSVHWGRIGEQITLN